MPQRYKVRLGDGTVVAVGPDGLETWAEDHRAVAQAVGTQQWRPLQDVLAEEQAAARLARALVPPTPRQKPAATPPPAPALPPLELPEFELGVEPPVVTPRPSRPSLQVLADEPVSSSRITDAEEVADDLPIIPLKPLEDEPVFQSAWSGSRDEDQLAEDEPRHDRLDGPLLAALETGGGFLSRCLDRLRPWADRLTAAPARGVDGDFGDERPSLYARASGWVVGLRARLRRPARPVPPAPKREPAPPAPRPASAQQPRAAPPPVSELPVLRLAEWREPRERADVYGGDEPSRFRFPNLQPIWLWTKRLVTVGALAAALAYVVLERDTWFPRTAEFGQTVFTQIDRQVLSRERRQQHERALADATSRLPELAPEAIELVFALSPTGVAEPGDVFLIAREATDRGQAALTPAEAGELRALQRQLLDRLSRTEAERVREYDRTRARRPIFPFENPHVMDLVARGARLLPPERLERLQALSHKAVAAGLDLTGTAAAPSPAR
jgi:hypothetical protein